MQMTIRSEGENILPRDLIILIMPRIISSAAVKSAITPSRSGRMVLMSWWVLPCIWRAWFPMATSRLAC